ncbi:Serine/threonine protein phosphatase PP1 isozyme 3, putative [Trichomonas vaginalis G3]|uniref:Serine/threonine-protein phosphatase n=1 Tax=Trichomonas vaginalis (strain ATCC PRA-98 / G3) TaxID=412133 RepID=A2FPC5_TRIV3|nr:protein phosphatase 2A family, catalytic domain family [Trichomonas vaginalis G3]EAX93238.1 Serine/threonine protein phosphatase PP1 isozyme 3, putative [Trichomonas vaginalis G3]KAI5516854.1 protein phosphatase 2A family, catalytic domain family [Trichomonas vaginalis G3]|eukprot:XP_001306168.1 Serine/threonine protein phosphatase PP1 isozyme 3 [Trichomonas vaginalis G3]
MLKSSSSPRLDRLLSKLQAAETMPRDTRIMLDVADIAWICNEAIKALKAEPVLLSLQAPLTIIGDLHGQFYDLLKFIKMGGNPGTTNYLFMGDYVDRGKNSVETFTYLLCLKVKYPNNFWLLRGNHETREISRLYGFYDECVANYSQDVWAKFTDVFDYLPIAAVISERIFCVHGGLSPELRELSQISKLTRPIRIPESGLLADLLWADPSNEHNGWRPSERGTSYSYGPDVVDNFLQRHDFDLVCRAHQVVDRGYEFPYNPKQTVLTVFSAPDYCEEFMNKGAMLKVDEELRCTFSFIDPPKKRSSNGPRRPLTPYY